MTHKERAALVAILAEVKVDMRPGTPFDIVLWRVWDKVGRDSEVRPLLNRILRGADR